MSAGAPTDATTGAVGGEPFVVASGLAMAFGGVEVLRDVDLDIRPGEVHAIIGENGAGKSTLMKILAGHLKPTRGTIRIDGQPVVLNGPVDAEHRGIVLVHQEILLAPDLTVAQNIYLGREIGKGLTVDDRAMNEGARKAVRSLGAATENPALVGAFGVNVPRMITLTYGFGVALAAFAGVLAAPIYSVNPNMGADLIIVVFAVVVIGGMGSIRGSIITGFSLGLIEGLTKVFYPEASSVVIFVIMAIVLLVKPAGLFGRGA